MEKKDIIMKALEAGLSAAKLYAGLHDLTIVTNSLDGNMSISVSLYPRDKKGYLKQTVNERGQETLVGFGWCFGEWDNVPVLENRLRDMCKTLNNPKSFAR